MKYLLTIKRTGRFEIRIAKDIATAVELESFLLESGVQEEFRDRFSRMPAKWRKDLMHVLKKYKSQLVDVLV